MRQQQDQARRQLEAANAGRLADSKKRVASLEKQMKTLTNATPAVSEPTSPVQATETVTQPYTTQNYDEAESAFVPGKKKRKDRSQRSKGTGQLRIPRTGVNTASTGSGGVNV